MFIGHFAVALASKRAAPRVSLGVLVAAAQLADLVWPIFLLLGWERVRIAPGDTAFTALDFEHYPWTHSLMMAIVWGVAFALAYWTWRRDSRGAMVVGLVVVSHWVLDYVTHRPDLPLTPWSGTRLGLGLWNSVAATMIIESLIFIAGVWSYLAMTRARDRVGRWALWSFIIFLVAVYLSGPLTGNAAPPSPRAVAWAALALWITPVWGAWIDRHRALQATTSESAASAEST